MSSLVEELQRDALDSNIPIADLLQKALVVATKLELDEFREWVELELNGYRAVDVPDYRKTIGQVVHHHPLGCNTDSVWRRSDGRGRVPA